MELSHFGGFFLIIDGTRNAAQPQAAKAEAVPNSVRAGKAQ